MTGEYAVFLFFKWVLIIQLWVVFESVVLFLPVLIREIPVGADSFQLFPILFKHRDIPLPWRGVRVYTDGVVFSGNVRFFFYKVDFTKGELEIFRKGGGMGGSSFGAWTISNFSSFFLWNAYSKQKSSYFYCCMKILHRIFPFLLLVYHLVFAWVGCQYILMHHGDAERYWFLGHDISHASWTDFLNPGTENNDDRNVNEIKQHISPTYF